MKIKKTQFYTGLLLGAFSLIATNTAFADAVIYNTGSAATATVALGILDAGHLNTSAGADGNITVNALATGLATKIGGAWYDATSPGCLCEGWGVSATIGGSGESGFANISTDGGVNNLLAGPIATDAGPGAGSFATTTASLISSPGLTVTQAYSAADSAPGVLFKNVVTISNTTGGTIDDVRYVRVMDWDIPFTEFSEAVTIKGTGTTSLLEMSHDDGFTSADPLSPIGLYGGIDMALSDCAGTLVDFVDCEGDESDHGAYFRFNFGSLADDESVSFTIFYGAASTEALADAAVAAEGIELFSYGQTDSFDTGGSPALGTPATYIFGFKGVGGKPVFSTPEPGSMLLMGLGLLGLGAIRRRRNI